MVIFNLMFKFLIPYSFAILIVIIYVQLTSFQSQGNYSMSLHPLVIKVQLSVFQMLPHNDLDSCHT